MTGDPNPISADVLNAAMEALGLADLRFEAVEGKPVLRRAYDDMSLEHFIGLLLTGIGAAHVQRVEVAKRLAELEDQVALLKANELDGVTRTAATRRIASLIAELRQTLTLPVPTQHRHQAVVPNLTIGPIEPAEDLD
jgi:hypothetical protein